ncbi:MAG: hypothetical protein IRZ09_15175 [Variibacter sp.]|nr:hypothetical protein [Variibacter sp.]
MGELTDPTVSDKAIALLHILFTCAGLLPAFMLARRGTLTMALFGYAVGLSVGVLAVFVSRTMIIGGDDVELARDILTVFWLPIIAIVAGWPWRSQERQSNQRPANPKVRTKLNPDQEDF